MKFAAEWIWTDTESVNDYNVLALFRREFELDEATRAELLITADSWYRLRINDQWVNDGPARAYPAHYRYDRLEVAPYLRSGRNVLEIEVRYFGCGTFHEIPVRAGLLARLEAETVTGEQIAIKTDSAWQAVRLHTLRAVAPKQSVQFPPFEIYDAAVGPEKFRSAVSLGPAGEGPFGELLERDVRLLTRQPFAARRLAAARVVAPEFPVVGLYLNRWCFPGTNQVNNSTVRCWALGINLRSAAPRKLRLVSDYLHYTLNGAPGAGNPGHALAPGQAAFGELELQAGDNFFFAVPRAADGHRADHYLGFPDGLEGVELLNPVTGKPGIAFQLEPELTREFHDAPGAHDGSAELAAAALARVREWLEQIHSADDFGKLSGRRLDLSPAELTGSEAAENFEFRRPLDTSCELTDGPALLTDGPEFATLQPASGGDPELVIDLGEQNCGYWTLEVTAPAGTVFDLFGIEYLTPQGEPQPTGEYHNGLRYLAREGHQRFVSLQRRSGRYLFLTVRGLTGPVKIHQLGLVESTYPVEETGDFQCSDQGLAKLWEISRRTLKLCMEDTFTDCPLYEQTFWVGDARNEALFTYETFGAYDLAARCLRLAGESLDYTGLVGCQVPSGWDAVLPAWSFLWGIAVYEYYFETGDLALLRELQPRVRQNLDYALAHRDRATGLFRLDAWNLFEWSATDSRPEIMIYNSMLLVGALNAAIAGGTVLGEETADWERARAELTAALDRVYDPGHGAWPDSITDGVPSKDFAVHTSMLAVLFGLTNADNREEVIRNLGPERPELIQIGSPFASFFFYQALERLGDSARILSALRRDYFPMLERGATTVWEVFGSSPERDGSDFPTRSHCHAWSAAPLYFLPRLVLGLTMLEPGGRRFAISPVIDGLDYASGRRPTVHGPIEVRWRKAEGKLRIEVSAPPGIELEYRFHPSHQGWQIELSGCNRIDSGL